MSICTPCTSLKIISKCTDSIIIGTMPSATTSYSVYFKNVATGKIVMFTGTSDGAKLLTITPPDGFNFSIETDYEVWSTINGDPIDDKVNVEPDGFTAYDSAMTCFLVTFVQVWAGMVHYNFNYTSQTFELE